MEEHENVCGARAVKGIALKSFNSVSNSRHVHSKSADNMLFSEYPLKNNVEFPKGGKKQSMGSFKQAFCSNFLKTQYFYPIAAIKIGPPVAFAL